MLLMPCLAYAQSMGVCCVDSVSEAWADEHMAEIKGMTRGEWLKLPSEGKRRVAYVRFTGEQRARFWKDKLTDVAANEGFSVEEKRHVMQLWEFLDRHKAFFVGKKLTAAQKDSLDSFMAKWSDEAEKKFGWSKRMILSIAASGGDAVVEYDRR